MNPITVIKSAFSVLYAGKELTHPAAWKNTQAIMGLLTAVACLATAAGHPIPISNEALGSLAIGVSGFASAYLTYATSAKVGLPESEPTLPKPTASKQSTSKKAASGKIQKELPPLNPSARSDLPELS